MPKQEYGADSLTVLEGLDAVRKRPGMYIGTTDSQGLMHCLWEIIDNAVDEALAGACDHITVTLHDDGSVEVADNGRGIPVDVEPKTKLTGVEVVLTKLHAGAKFGNASYNAAGGLHGVGSSVVNALSSRLDVEVDRDGKTHHMAFHQGHPGVYSDTDPEHPSPDAPFKRTRKNRPTELEIIGKVSPKTICFVDNCYGEFAAEREPIEAGADIIAGSLIKNPGGGIAPTGGYIAGKAELVEAAADYLTAPGLGDELGSYAAGYRLFFQGFFMAPHVTAQAIKGAVFAAAVFEKMGFRVSPAVTTPRVDLIQTIYLENEQNMCLFCQGIQGFSPVDAHVTPIPDDMPGYADKIIMAAGDFVQGSSIELSADGPIRDPYMIYLQGGIVFEHNVLAILSAAQYIAEHREGAAHD